MKDFQTLRSALIDRHAHEMLLLDKEEELHKKLPDTFSGRSFVVMHGYKLRESGETGYIHLEPTLEEASEILRDYPAVDFGLGYFTYGDQKVNIPLYKIDINSGVNRKDIKISWSIGDGFNVNMKLDYKPFLSAGLLKKGERRATESEHVHFMGTRREDLSGIRIQTIEFSEGPLFSYYGGHKKMIDPASIQKFLDFIHSQEKKP